MVRKSPEVYVASDSIVRVSRQDIAWLKSQVAATARGRIRLCAHRHGEDPVHEMLIVLAQRSYVRPHKHHAKCESFHIIEGDVDVVVFDDTGGIREVLPLGEPASGRPFFYRLDAPAFHTLILRSDPVVLHETTAGPFRPGDAEFASWAPAEDDPTACTRFTAELTRRVDEHLAQQR